MTCSQNAQKLHTCLFHLSLHHHLCSSLADLTAFLHSFIIFIISFIPITTMASSIRTNLNSIPLKSLEPQPLLHCPDGGLTQKIVDNILSSRIFFTLRLPQKHECQQSTPIIFLSHSPLDIQYIFKSQHSHLHF
jgi:hypothetical protein